MSASHRLWLFGAHRLALGTALLVAISGSAMAAGDGGSGPVMNCPTGQIRDADGKCKPQTNNAIDQDARISYGLALAKAERYDEALSVLRGASDQGDPRVLNYIGYSLRKSGKLDEGIGYYMKALAADPDYVQAREYLGEAYLTMGRIDLAEVQLKEIEARCNGTCDVYLDLSNQIEDFRERAARG